MKSTMGPAGALCCGLGIACLFTVVGAMAADAPAGERWRQTQSMQMMGMTMPARTTEFCKEAGSNDLPVRPDKDCRIHDVKRTPAGATFKMSCTGQHASEAEGEMTFIGPGRTHTQLHMRMAEGEMTMNMDSEKLGACTGNENNLVAKRQLVKAQEMSAKLQAEQQQQHAKMCADAARAADNPALMMKECNDAPTVKTYCSNFQSYDVFRKQAEEEARNGDTTGPGVAAAQLRPLTTSGQLCGVDPQKLRERLCSTAESQDQLAFIASQCPVQGQAIARRECAGRSYTNVAARYYAICTTFAQAAQQAPADQPKPQKPSPLSKGKKILGGLLGN
jgi:hypothetical protein